MLVFVSQYIWVMVCYTSEHQYLKLCSRGTEGRVPSALHRFGDVLLDRQGPDSGSADRL